jgi:pimeloyl-ACP methyl ester carboxylesterase
MDIQLSYEETGAGEPLVLLHGNGEDRSYFRNQIAAFSAFRRVIAVDMRGHGQSPRGGALFTLSQFADDLAVLMDELSLQRADILGYSDGGNVALLFALRYPGRVRKLVLNGANLRPSGMKLRVWLGIEARYSFDCVAALFSAGAVRERERYGLMAVQPNIRPKELAALATPTLVVAGTRDVIRERHTRRIAESLSNGKLVFLEGGHALAQENPKAFNEAVKAFLAGR